MPDASGWIINYRGKDDRTKVNRCLICGVNTGSSQKFLCKDRYCKLTLNIVAKKVITRYYDSIVNGKNIIRYTQRLAAWGSSKPSKYFWYVLPDRSIIDQKYKEVISKYFLLKKLSEVEFIRLFQTSNTSFCNPCQLIFNRISYEKHNSILIP